MIEAYLNQRGTIRTFTFDDYGSRIAVETANVPMYYYSNRRRVPHPETGDIIVSKGHVLLRRNQTIQLEDEIVLNGETLTVIGVEELRDFSTQGKECVVR